MATSESEVLKAFAEVIGGLGPSESAVYKEFAEVIGGLGPSESGVWKLFAEVIADSNITPPRYVSGVVTVQGVATAGLTVRAYDQTSGGTLLGSAVTASDGSYRIMCYANSSDLVFVVAFDPTTYQALVFDQVQPQ